MRDEWEVDLSSGHTLVIGRRDDGRPRYYFDLISAVNGAQQIELGQGKDWESTMNAAISALREVIGVIEGREEPVEVRVSKT